MTKPEQNIAAIPAQYYITDSEQHDEIDLFELVASIVKQWKLILLISFIGTLLGVSYAFSLSKQYENITQVRAPLESDLQVLKLNGYGVDLKSLFLRLHDNFKSQEVFKQYLVKSNSITQFYPKLTTKKDMDSALLSLTSNINVNFIDNENKKTKSGEQSRTIQVKLESSNQDVAIDVLNNYIPYVAQNILKQIQDRSKFAINLRKQEIQKEIDKLRNLTKQKRLNAIADLKETLNVANIMGVTNTLFAVSASNPKSKTLNLFLNNQVNQFQKYMLGSDYLNAEINRLKSRGSEITADDAFIPTMPTLLSELSVLSKKSFNFDGAKLYTLDKLAALNDAPVKPNKRLIALIGMLLSGFLALFVALIVSTVQKRKLADSPIKQ